MPQFFLHIHDDDEFIEDPEGRVYPDLNAAREEAKEAAREILADKVRRGVEIDGQRIDITDEKGSTVATVKFRDQLRLRPEI